MTTKAILTAAFLTLFGFSAKAPSTEIKTKHLEEILYEIGMKSTTDNIERGGIITGQDVHEIENEARQAPECFKKFVEGADENYVTLKSQLFIACDVRATCDPELAHVYHIYSINLNSKLDFMLTQKPEQRKEIALIAKPLFEYFLPSGIYMAAQKAPEGSIHFHTHPNGDPPSLQDIKISHDRKEYVVSVTKEGDFTLYLADKGEIKVIYTRR